MQRSDSDRRETRRKNAKKIGAIFGTFVAVATVFGLAVQIYEARRAFVDSKHERRLDKLERRLEEFESLRMRFHRAEAARIHPGRNHHVRRIFLFLNKLALEEQRNVLTTEDVERLFGPQIIFYWCAWKTWVVNLRDREEDEEIYKPVEILATKLIERDKKVNECFTSDRILKERHWEVRYFVHEIDFRDLAGSWVDHRQTYVEFLGLDSESGQED